MNEKELFRKLQAALLQLRRMRIPVYAAHACYFIVLSVFPMLVLLLGLLRYTGLSVTTLTDALSGIVPQALYPSAKKLVLSTYYNTSGTVLSLSALTALWSAARGIGSLRTGLNAIYDAPESRGYFYTRLLGMVYTLLLLSVLVLTLFIHVFGTAFLQLLSGLDSPLLVFLSELIDFRLVLLLALQTALFCALYAVLPNRKNTFLNCLPGALLTALCWTGFSSLYSLYVEYFPFYSGIYGSVYAVALIMLWLYCCICIVFYGGVLNRYWSAYRKKASDPPKG